VDASRIPAYSGVAPPAISAARSGPIM
jgi:hypothetical protein